ncbi:FecR family protein [Puia dinghuensis]|uniref:FecR family protein n=1 Tax=Puia dinghuensis TaxID=1792502 RepID=A0A8J2UJE6_9BACT|nr:FecR domain-containing protein [Puia dinghuensis]GGB25170.1 hypothetical protein GCM10011511_56400 [Puia dinghuensis]
MYNSDDLDEQSWEDFQPDENQPTPTQKMRDHIEHHVGKSPVRKLWIGWVAAASVVGLAGLAGLRIWKNEKPPVVTAAASQKQQPRLAAKQTITNSTSETKVYTLPDGSKVRLAKGSTIIFDSGFTASRRDIALTGEATFTVARDKVKPFTVHSKDIAVTALGTVFGVDDTHSGFTTVLLYSGKVVVKKEEPARRPSDAADRSSDPADRSSGSAARSFADVYLSPGQQLTVNRTDLSVSIKMAIEPKTTPEKAPAPIPQQMMTFTRQPLADIFKELQATYHITITYDPAGVKNMDFTGTFNSEKETLESFLSTLCSLNDLTLKKTKGKGFSIRPAAN